MTGASLELQPIIRRQKAVGAGGLREALHPVEFCAGEVFRQEVDFALD